MDKKLKKAAAIYYEEGTEAPRVIAQGKGEVADKIVETAIKNDVPVFEDSGLVDTLLQLELGQHIPPELYAVVAEILVFISNIDRLKGDIYGKE